MGRFEIVGVIAQGGLGKVFEVRDMVLDREMALKEVRPDRDAPDARSRLAREARLNGRLEHPGVVPVFGLGCHPDGRPFYVMRLVDGETLGDALTRFHSSHAPTESGRRPLALQDLLGYYLRVCDAVDYAHSRGVIHRDLKPANVMLGRFGETLVVDWGLAKSFEPSDLPDTPSPPLDDPGGFETAHGQAVGTPHYMSPEQARGRHDLIGPASDIYSLGATLFDLLTGRPPFGDSTDSADILRRVAEGDYPHPRQVNPRTPKALEAVCLKAMSLRPEDRYQSAGALADDVRRWLADEPVSARPEPLIERARRWAGRHRVAVASAVSAVVMAVVIGIPLVFQAGLRESEARTRILDRIDTLTAAPAEALPALISGLKFDRKRTLPLLKERWSRDRSLPVALALGPDDIEARGYLRERLFDTDFALLPVVCQALVGMPVGGLWTEFESGDLASDRPFLAASILARLNPPRTPADLLRWEAKSGLIVKGCLDQIARRPGNIEVVHETFHPVRRALFGALARVYRAVPRDEFDPDLALRRTIAAGLLDRFVDWPEGLAELILDTLPGPRLPRYLERLRTAGSPALAALEAVFLRQDDGAGLLELPDDPERRAGELARRKVRVASALFKLGRPEPVWPALGRKGDPTLRDELTLMLASFGPGALRALADRLAVERDPRARQSLTLALDGFPAGSIPDEDRRALTDRLLDFYRHDPDPGVHSASDWLLRGRWGEGARLGPFDLSSARANPSEGLGWYINGQGQTLAVVRGPVTARLGSPADEPGRDDSEVVRTRLIERSFAVSTREITLAEFRRFLPDRPDLSPPLDDPEFLRMMPTNDAPVVGLTWYEAAGYCNWLSRKEGIPESQWCDPSPATEGLRLDPVLTERTGYRLPTEAEWEFVCRAGALTSRSFGASWDRSFDHGWFVTNSGGRLHPVGSKRPNGLGLFDMLGNAAEWTLDRYQAPPEKIDTGFVTKSQSRVVKGGSVLLPERPRPAQREGSLPSSRSTRIGFRVARTCS